MMAAVAIVAVLVLVVFPLPGASAQTAAASSPTDVPAQDAGDAAPSQPTPSGSAPTEPALSQPAQTPPASPQSRVLNVGLYVSPPFVQVRPDGGYSGMAIDLWEDVALHAELAFKYERYSTLRELVDATRTGRIDVAVTNLTITHRRAELIEFTQPWYDAGLRIMVADDGEHGFWGLVSGLRDAGHLRAYAWLAFVIGVATVALTIFDRRFDPAFPKRWHEGVAESLFHVVSIATSGKTARKNLFGWKGRIWSAFWMVCGVATIAYVTSSVTSVMTAVSLNQGISSLADLPGKTVAVFTGSVSEEYVGELGIASRSYPNIDEAVVALKDGSVDAIVGDAPILEYYAHNNPAKKLTVVGNIFHPDKYGFGLPRGSRLEAPITLQILALRENGTLEKLRLGYFGSSF